MGKVVIFTQTFTFISQLWHMSFAQISQKALIEAHKLIFRCDKRAIRIYITKQKLNSVKLFVVLTSFYCSGVKQSISQSDKVLVMVWNNGTDALIGNSESDKNKQLKTKQVQFSSGLLFIKCFKQWNFGVEFCVNAAERLLSLISNKQFTSGLYFEIIFSCKK